MPEVNYEADIKVIKQRLYELGSQVRPGCARDVWHRWRLCELDCIDEFTRTLIASSPHLVRLCPGTDSKPKPKEPAERLADLEEIVATTVRSLAAMQEALEHAGEAMRELDKALNLVVDKLEMPTSAG